MGMNMYKAVIFDLDGTLLDTLKDLQLSVNYALNLHSMPERSLDEVRRFVGNGIAKLIERSVTNATSKEECAAVLEDFKAYYAVHNSDNTVPYDGICEMLENLNKAGIKTAVVTNKIDSAAKKLCDEMLGIDVAIGDSPERKKKPSPDSVYEALDLLGVSIGDAVYVGDSDVDIETAKNAGMDCISVTWGFRDKMYLKKCGAAVFADAPYELENLICK